MKLAISISICALFVLISFAVAAPSPTFRIMRSADTNFGFGHGGYGHGGYGHGGYGHGGYGHGGYGHGGYGHGGHGGYY